MSAGPSDPHNPQSNPYQASQQANLEPAVLAPLGQLGSLSQSARLKNLNTAKRILIWIGAVIIFFNGIQLVALRDAVHNALDQQVQQLHQRGLTVDPAKLKEAEDRGVLVGMLVGGGFVAVGAALIVLGLVVAKFPVPATVAGLIIYLVYTLVNVWLLAKFGEKGHGDLGSALMQGALLRIVVLVALAKAIQSARAYEQERRIEVIQGIVAAESGR